MMEKTEQSESMNGWSRKIFLKLPVPNEEDFRPDTERILQKVREREEFRNEEIRFSFRALRLLCPICEQAGWEITLLMAFDGRAWEITDVQQGDTSGEHFGYCMDLGSTTIIMQLINMNDGTVKAESSCFNPQISYGTDILTRIFYTKDQPEKLEEMRRATIQGIVGLMDDLKKKTEISPESCAFMVVAGNTTMIHFLLGLDAFCVFHTPYAVHTLRPDIYSGECLGLPLRGFVYCCPAKANYLGGDIISGLIATEIADREEISVFLDIGTNGELVVGNREFLIAGAGAAGPALEGGVVKTGMRAEEGAVDTVQILDQKIQIHTIGEKEARGICGSGIVDLLAQMFLNGWLDIRGKLLKDKNPAIEENQGEMAVLYAPGLYFYQSDIDEFLKTKAAAVTMVEYMMQMIGLNMEDVSRFYIAGAFGTHISKESGVTIGLYPDIERSNIISPGNTSLLGTAKILLDRSCKDKMEQILDKMEYIQFGAVDDFLHLMVAATAIPHTDYGRFPSVVEKLRNSGISI